MGDEKLEMCPPCTVKDPRLHMPSHGWGPQGQGQKPQPSFSLAFWRLMKAAWSHNRRSSSGSLGQTYRQDFSSGSSLQLRV